MTKSNPLTVYYDGECPRCSQEIGRYRRQKRGEDILSFDINGSTSEWATPQLSTCDSLRKLHVKKTDGSFVSGAAAFSALWRELPRFKVLGVFVELPFVTAIAEFTYHVFLKIRIDTAIFLVNQMTCPASPRYARLMPYQ